MADLNQLFDSTEGLLKDLGMEGWPLKPKQADPPSPRQRARRLRRRRGLPKPKQELFSFSEAPAGLASRVTHLSPQPKVGAQLGCKSGIALARHYFSEDTLRRNPGLLLIFAGGGALLGHRLDTHVLPNYPSFRMVLEAVNSIM